MNILDAYELVRPIGYLEISSFLMSYADHPRNVLKSEDNEILLSQCVAYNEVLKGNNVLVVIDSYYRSDFTNSELFKIGSRRHAIGISAYEKSFWCSWFRFHDTDSKIIIFEYDDEYNNNIERVELSEIDYTIIIPTFSIMHMDYRCNLIIDDGEIDKNRLWMYNEKEWVIPDE